MAEVGNNVLCLDLDLDTAKIKTLLEGGIPIHGPGLLEVVSRNVAAVRLHFTTNVEQAVHHGTIQFIAVGTPPDEDGSADLTYLLAASPPMTLSPCRYAVTCSEEVIDFSCAHDTLVGVLGAPESAASLGVVVLVVGPQYRAGSHGATQIRSQMHIAKKSGGKPRLRLALP